VDSGVNSRRGSRVCQSTAPANYSFFSKSRTCPVQLAEELCMSTWKPWKYTTAKPSFSFQPAIPFALSQLFYINNTYLEHLQLL